MWTDCSPWKGKPLTHWVPVTHICVGNLTIIGPDNGLSPGRRQAIIWTNAWILLIGPWGRNYSEILIGIQTFSFKKMHLKMSSAKWRPFCLGLNVLIVSLNTAITATGGSWLGQKSMTPWHGHVDSLIKIQWCGALMVPQTSYWTDDLVASDLRRHGAHVTSLYCVTIWVLLVK